MSTTHASATRAGIDPRGPQFTAAVTALVLVVALVTLPGTVGVVIVAAQTALFAIGAGVGVQRTPVAWVFRTLLRPRLGAPEHLEDPAPPRFAQTVGLGFGVVALAGFLTGLDPLGYAAVGFALVAALLNAVFRFCLGCELYLLFRRVAPRSTAPATN